MIQGKGNFKSKSLNYAARFSKNVLLEMQPLKQMKFDAENFY